MSGRKFIPVKSPDKRGKSKLVTHDKGLVLDRRRENVNRKYTFQEINPTMATDKSTGKKKGKKRNGDKDLKGLKGMINEDVTEFNVLDLVKDSSQKAEYVNKKAFFQKGKIKLPELTGISLPPVSVPPVKDIVAAEPISEEPKATPKRKTAAKKSIPRSKTKKSTKATPKRKTKSQKKKEEIVKEKEEEKVEEEIEEKEVEDEEVEDIETENDLSTEKGMMEELNRLGFNRLSTKRRKVGDGTYPMHAKQVDPKRDGFSKEMNLTNIIKVLDLAKSGKKSDIINRIKDKLKQSGYKV